MLNIYILTKLYSIHDRLRACRLERSIIDLLGPDVNCYMPYRDSEEDKIPVDKWSETIFQYDLSALQSADLLLGFWDGPAFDEGIGFEIGCGLAWGKKTVVLNTDFLQYHLGGKDIYETPDSLLFTWPIQWVRQDFEMRSKDTFQEDMERALDILDEKIGDLLGSEEMLDLSQAGRSFPDKKNGGIYIEPGPTRSGLRWAADIKECAGESSDCRITFGKRFLAGDFKGIGHESDADRQAMDGADHMVFYASGPELPPGLAVSAGWAYGRDVPFDLVLDRSACMVGMTGALMPVNLMLQEAASWTGSSEEYGIRLQELLGSDC